MSAFIVMYQCFEDAFVCNYSLVMSQCFEDVVFALISRKYGYGALITFLVFVCFLLVVLLWCFGICMRMCVRGGVRVCVRHYIVMAF